ncbi:hypothetical protein [Mesorhizobium sp. M8A.F.Ca.ET.165.01.1.1]|uniref:hypothetical protein n=1 Tax=Mesorhizobium sp. M8A.F.Ca.ET.165.01.1.1 TaxID=2563960 RepID=UPI0010939244|nr:hypothetical protein [Mesorhizobium sp. M8A.F.Ca.ET.165.01.1.1]TGT44417.1 hypothetical protein EN808_08665 [Mesorhizobium sp. M8A.F.Ca.ET.165.01.1.1]
MGELEQQIDIYLGEWLAELPPPDAGVDWYRDFMKSERPGVFLEVAIGPTSFVNLAGNRALNRAADLLLERTGEQRRVSHRSARRALLEAHKEHIPKALKLNRFSEHAIVQRAIVQVERVKRASGIYVLPVVFAPMAKNTDVKFGPMQLLSAKVFKERYDEVVETAGKIEGESRFVEGWQTYSKDYDHFILVAIDDHEYERARIVAREVAELLLNLIRLAFRFGHTDDIRIGDGFIWEKSRASVYFDTHGTPQFAHSSGPWGSILEDNWKELLDDRVGHHQAIVASLAGWMASGTDAGSPILERLRYASALIAEAYSEPHDRIRLVRLISALEALALLPREEKAHGLALHSAWAGGWGEMDIANDIYDAVRGAYLVRNQIVHGDGPPESLVMQAFHRLEKHLGRIWLGMLHIYVLIYNRDRPKHIRQLRRAFGQYIETFFWNPDML